MLVAVEAETRTHTKSSYVVCYYKAIEQPRTVKPASQFLLLLAATLRQAPAYCWATGRRRQLRNWDTTVVAAAAVLSKGSWEIQLVCSYAETLRRLHCRYTLATSPTFFSQSMSGHVLLRTLLSPTFWLLEHRGTVQTFAILLTYSLVVHF